jgi:hypothetical protein
MHAFLAEQRIARQELLKAIFEWAEQPSSIERINIVTRIVKERRNKQALIEAKMLEEQLLLHNSKSVKNEK